MVIYFADRHFNIIGLATTQLPNGLVIIDDLKTEQLDTGVKIFELTLTFNAGNRAEIEAMIDPANYILRADNDDNEFYTIIDAEISVKNRSAKIYAEDAGLDMLNDICAPYKADKAMTAAEYIEIFAADSGFEVGQNEIAELTRTLEWEGEETAAERIRSVATEFDNAEISYSFEIKNLTITKKYINIYKKRGIDVGVTLRYDDEIDDITVKKSVANLATALYVTGGTPSGKSSPITLQGYEYDDGDFYSPKDSAYLYSRNALAKWSRMNWEQGTGTGNLEKMFTYDTPTQSTLCTRAVSELKKLCEPEINYEIEIARLNDKQVGLGDTIYIVDDLGELYLSARVQQIETSVTADSKLLTLGDYLIRSSGISEKVTALSEQFGTVTRQIENSMSNVLNIESSNGLIFKEGVETTLLNVTIYRGSTTIANLTELRSIFGQTAHLRWSQLIGAVYIPISASDPRLSNGSFTMTISSADVTEKNTYKCELVVDGTVV